MWLIYRQREPMRTNESQYKSINFLSLLSGSARSLLDIIPSNSKSLLAKAEWSLVNVLRVEIMVYVIAPRKK